MTEKKGEKVKKYQDIARGSKNVGCKDKVIPVVIGALGSVPMNLKIT